ncbi:MAG: hypothetical protein RLZZ322_1329 [Verrucomicrobiota bacterium]|jgi:hypothetical protein
MSPSSHSPATVVLPAVEIAAEARPLDPVVVHVRCAPHYAHALRIWQSTFLLDRDSSHASAMIGFENISLYPHWTPVPFGRTHRFTLLFEPLPKSVLVFDLSEVIPEPRGWHFPAIRRNPEDVYRLDLPN